VAQKSPKFSLKINAAKVEGWPSYLRTSSSAKVARVASGAIVQKKKA
jgi:hypothetical protein